MPGRARHAVRRPARIDPQTAGGLRGIDQPAFGVLRKEGLPERRGGEPVGSRGLQGRRQNLRDRLTMSVASQRIELKSAREIDLLRKAGQLAARILMELKGKIVAGMTTGDI